MTNPRPACSRLHPTLACRFRTAALTLATVLAIWNGAAAMATSPANGVTTGVCRIYQARDSRDLCRGEFSQGRLGDWVLENALMRVVISARNGAVLDAAIPPDYLDAIGAIQMNQGLLDAAPDQWEAPQFTAAPTNGSTTATLTVQRRRRDQPDVLLTTTFRLAPDDRAVTVETTLAGTDGDGPMSNSDRIDWGPLTPLMPGKGYPQDGATSAGVILGGFTMSDDAQLGYLTAGVPFTLRHYQDSQSLIHQSLITLPATLSDEDGASPVWRRTLLIADRNFTAITDQALQLMDAPQVTIDGIVSEQGTGRPLAHCPVRIQGVDLDGTADERRDWTWAITDERGYYSAQALPGKYFPWALPLDGRGSVGTHSTRPLTDGMREQRDLVIDPPLQVSYRIVDGATREPCPARITFIPVPPTQPINMGPPRGAISRNSYAVAEGTGQIAVPPGNYQVIVTRGIEYEAVQLRLTVTEGGANTIFAMMRRMMDTSGYVSVDPGVLTRASHDGLLTLEDRLITAAAEGVQIVISGDDGVVTDLSRSPMAETLAPWLRTVAGKRIRLSRQGRLGEAVVFPLDPDQDHGEQTAAAYAAPDGLELLARLRRHYPDALIQVNNPLEEYGLFSQGDIFASNNGAADNAASPTATALPPFDLLELANGRRPDQRMDNLALWLNLVQQGRPIAPSASSQSRGAAGMEIGYPRLYVASSTDDLAEVDLDEIWANLRAGRVIITNGPFVQFQVNGAGLGDMVTVTGGMLDMEMHVQRSPWSDLRFARLLANQDFLRQMTLSPSQGTVLFPDLQTDESPLFPVYLQESGQDLAVYVIAEGRESLFPMLHGRHGLAMRPFCITGPVYVDGTDDGKVFGFTPPGAATP